MDEPEKETIIDSNQRQSVATVGERSEHTGRESREEGWHRPLKSVQPSWERRELWRRNEIFKGGGKKSVPGRGIV